MPKSSGKLPAVTILIEWENAMDVEAYWVHRALQAFAAELAPCQDDMSTPASRPRCLILAKKVLALHLPHC